MRALDRRQSATSLVRLLRDPLGYLWTYGFRWSEPGETDQPLTLDALAFGKLLHEILEEAVNQIEGAGTQGLGGASSEAIAQAIACAGEIVGTRWDEIRPVPPSVIWRNKLSEAVELARVALTHQEDALPDQQSWADIPFGGDQRAKGLTVEARSALPWDPMAAVPIPGTTIHIGGSIDRLDLAGDESAARVTDYKSGRLRGRPFQLKGGAELQRCLYAYAVKALIASHSSVDAHLLYPRSAGRLLPLNDPEGTLERLAAFLAAAAASFADGKALSGPAAKETWYDLAFALPGGAKENYLPVKWRLVAQALSNVEPLWGEL